MKTEENASGSNFPEGSSFDDFNFNAQENEYKDYNENINDDSSDSEKEEAFNETVEE